MISTTDNAASQQAAILQQYHNILPYTLASQGSTGSKTSTGSSVVSSSTKESNCNATNRGSQKLKIPVISEAIDREAPLHESTSNNPTVPNGWLHNPILDPDLPNTEDPNILSQLQFISPKAGVFRPVVESSSSTSNSIKKSLSLGRGVKLKKHNACSVM